MINGYGNTKTNKFCQLLTGWGTYWFPLKQINIPEPPMANGQWRGINTRVAVQLSFGEQ